jgi:predicted nuclease of predicted toxin-antitoxin system
MPGAGDRMVLALAQAEQRIVLTADTDFGELAFRSRLPAECGVILIRIDWTNPDNDNQVVINALTSRDSWSGNFAVIERDRIRIRPLPSGDATPPAKWGWTSQHRGQSTSKYGALLQVQQVC